MTEKRFHPFAVLHLLRKTILVYLLPLLQVFFARNWAALRTALLQDAVLFAVLFVVSWTALHASRWRVDVRGDLQICWRLGIRFDRTLRAAQLAALTIDRPILYRMAGASRVALYPAGQARAMTLTLSRQDADWLADRLLPVEQPVVHRPRGGEKLVFTVLGANSLSTLALLALAVRQSQPYAPDAQTYAFAHLSRLAAWAARWLPAGTAWLLVLFGTLFCASLCRTQLNYADVRRSPATWALHFCPVFVTAGCCQPELPLFVWHEGSSLLEELLPGLALPPDARPDPRRRSRIFYAAGGIPLGLCLLLTAVSRYTLPALTLPLLIPTAFFAALTAAAAVGRRKEGVWQNAGQLTFRRQHRFHLHCICVLHPDVCLTLQQSPWAAAVQRANLVLTFPGRLKFKVRSVTLRELEFLKR